MKKSLMHVLLCALFFAAPAFAGCDVPVAPEIPKGFSATTTEMQQTKAEIETYIAQVQAYVNCGVSNTQAQKMTNVAKDVLRKYNMEYQAFLTRS